MQSTRLQILLFATLLFLSSFPSQHQRAQTKKQRELDDRAASVFEIRQTEKLLGVPVQTFPDPQGLTGFDELPANRPAPQFTINEHSLTGPRPKYMYELRTTVKARAPDGSVYEAYSGRQEEDVIEDSAFASTAENTRQFYGTHHGYGYNPQDVYIGKRLGARIKPALFFRDVGSHDTAPYHFAIDNKGMVHLIVADVNIFQRNRLDLYWVRGDLSSGKWTAAWLVDRRGFTSWSHPWSAAWADKVHGLWNWCDESVHKNAPGMGIIYLQWGPNGFGRKVRVVKGIPQSWDAAVDPQSGRLLLVYSNANGVFTTYRPETGTWRRPTVLKAGLRTTDAVSVSSGGDGTFIIRTGSEDTREWVVRPR
jgi:hypothetical protein